MNIILLLIFLSKYKVENLNSTYKRARLARFDMLDEISPLNPLDDKSLVKILNTYINPKHFHIIYI